ncbi:MAG: cobyric acid synthase [Crenarchaeota archaeon]|nr:cobyric acid synthase [Thermoproteota archaeon]
MTCIAVLGTSSNCGKSTITALLCRLFHKNGLKVTPFKPQNMSLNSTSTWYGEEIAYIQYIQAKLCNVEATAHINPVLIKPYGYRKSEIIVLGRPRFFTTPEKYYSTIIEKLRDIVEISYKTLSRNYDIIVMEGAGCAYEPNLENVDIANLEIPRKFDDVKIILVADIYEGGAFTSLYGTYVLLPEKIRRKVIGFIINRFCGDIKILEPALRWIEERTGKPVITVLPLTEKLNIFPEDSASLSKIYNQDARIDIAVIYYPYISNFGELALLAHHPDISIRFVYKPAELGEPDLVILPGCRNTFKAIEHLRKTGLDKKLKRIVGSIPILGICAGFQILSKKISDPTGLETGTPTHVRGLELIDIEFTYSEKKIVSRVCATSPLLDNEKIVEGFEIHRALQRQVRNPMFEVLCRNKSKCHHYDGHVDEKNRIYGTFIHEAVCSIDLLEKIISRNLSSLSLLGVLTEKIDNIVSFLYNIVQECLL